MSLKFRTFVAAIAFAAVSASAPAYAQEEAQSEGAEIDSSASATEEPADAMPVIIRDFSIWEHEKSSIRLPKVIEGFTRGNVNRFDTDGYNVGVSFTDEESGSWADIYIYRAGIPSVPMWGDRAASLMLSGDRLGKPVEGELRVSTFTPPNGAGADSGWRVVSGLDGEATATGLAIYLHDGWLIKMRMSSRSLDSAAMDARIASFIDTIETNEATEPAPPFTAIEDCEDKLKFRRRARLIQLDMMASLLIGTTISVAREKALEQEGERQLWCRDESTQDIYGIYRNRGDDDSYTMALGDSGLTLSVGRYDLGPLMNPSRGFLVTQSDGVTDLVYPPFNRLPEPRLIGGIPGNLSPIATFDTRPGAEGGATIIVPSPSE